MSDPVNGEWESITIEDSGVTSIHAHLLPDGKILFFHARYCGEDAKFTSYCHDPSDDSLVQYLIPVWDDLSNPDLQQSAFFCSGHTFLEDGKLLVAGGERARPPVSLRGIKYSYYYDPFSITTPGWSQIAIMNRGRWYPQLTRLPSGKVVAMSGFNYDGNSNGIDSVLEIHPELFDPDTNEWSEYSSGANKSVPLYNDAYVIPFGDYAGQIYYGMVAWGMDNTWWDKPFRFNPDPNASSFWHEYGDEGISRGGGNSVMLPIKNSDSVARIINLGGHIANSNPSDDYNTASMIEIGGSSPTWTTLDSMQYKRHDSPNALLLADGSLVVFGGDHTKYPEKLDYSDLNPSNWEWSTLNAQAFVDRRYHSTALLLPDGRVWTGGSRLYRGRNEFEDDMERQIEIYRPGYMDDGTRPEITDAPDNITYSEDFSVYYNVSGFDVVTINSVVLISLPSVTHCFDANQKYVILNFEIVVNGELRVTPPSNSNIAQPGPYMLYLLRDKDESTSQTNRLPSIAKIVFLS
jgi:galactose oxidase